MKELIDAHRTCLEKEYREDKLNKQRYTLSEAERRVRDCFAGSFVCDYTNIFPSKATDEGTLRIDQTYDIFDIQKAIQYFDSKSLLISTQKKKGLELMKRKRLMKKELALNKNMMKPLPLLKLSMVLVLSFKITSLSLTSMSLNWHSMMKATLLKY